MPSPEGRNYVAYIPVPINNEDEDDEEEYDDEYEDDEYYDDDDDEEYEDDEEYYEDDDEEVNDYSIFVYQLLRNIKRLYLPNVKIIKKDFISSILTKIILTKKIRVLQDEGNSLMVGLQDELDSGSIPKEHGHLVTERTPL